MPKRRLRRQGPNGAYVKLAFTSWALDGGSQCEPKHPGNGGSWAHPRQGPGHTLVRAYLGRALSCAVLVSASCDSIRSEKAHSNSNRPGSAESGPITITMEIVGPVGPFFGPTAPNMSIVIVFNSPRACPGQLLVLCTFSLRI